MRPPGGGGFDLAPAPTPGGGGFDRAFAFGGGGFDLAAAKSDATSVGASAAGFDLGGGFAGHLFTRVLPPKSSAGRGASAAVVAKSAARADAGVSSSSSDNR